MIYKQYHFTIIILLSFVISVPVFSQHSHSKKTADKNPAILIPGLGTYHHPVTTDNQMAQKFFDQGLTLIYAFNHNEAIRSFKKAAELDPDMAMAYWGIAFALGPNYNLAADSEQRKQAYNSLKKAQKLSENATQKEKDYITAIAKRYSKDVNTDPKILNEQFRMAMRDLKEKYPNDVDAATLYAESMMVLKPWQLWDVSGSPVEGTEEIVSVLESVIQKDPDHPGANHYYIHAVEASKNPGRALHSAKVLMALVPAAGHLVHMPAHILFRVGDYEGASVSNINAINSDKAYIDKHKPEGIYPIMYYNHNINFLSVSRMMEGRFAEAIKAANEVAVNVKPLLKEMFMLEGFYGNPLLILIAFNRWDDILKYPAPDIEANFYSAIYHFSKGLAYAETGNGTAAKNELSLFVKSKEKVPGDAGIGNNSAATILSMTMEMLEAKIAVLDGDNLKAVELLKKAIEKEDQLVYNEPPDWYPSVRLMLGKVLYKMGNYEASEKIFRDDLAKYPHNGRGLFGLIESLKSQGKNDESEKLQSDLDSAWKNADTKLTMENL